MWTMGALPALPNFSQAMLDHSCLDFHPAVNCGSRCGAARDAARYEGGYCLKDGSLVWWILLNIESSTSADAFLRTRSYKNDHRLVVMGGALLRMPLEDRIARLPDSLGFTPRDADVTSFSCFGKR